MEAMNETHFKRFLMIIRSSGFITKKMLGSSINVINFSYILYLYLRREGVNDALIEKYVRRWFVLSKLTGRYSMSVESSFDRDMKLLEGKDFGVLDTLSAVHCQMLTGKLHCQSVWTPSELDEEHCFKLSWRHK